MQTYSNQYPYGYALLANDSLAPVFSFKTDAFFISFQHFLNKKQPIMLFFCNALHTKQITTDLINDVHLQLTTKQIQPIFIFNDGSGKLCKKLGLSQQINWFIDDQNLIAEQFGLYNEDNPLTNWLTGIDNDAAILPAVFAVLPNRNLAHAYADFEGHLFQTASHTYQMVQDALDSISRQQLTNYYLPNIKQKMVS